MRRRPAGIGARATAALGAAGVLLALAGALGVEARAAGTTPVIARFIARTSQPKADTPWSYCVLAVTGSTVTPLEASVKQRLFDERGNPAGDVGSASFYGAWCQAIKLPASIRGDAITLETKVTVAQRVLVIRTPIRVR